MMFTRGFDVRAVRESVAVGTVITLILLAGGIFFALSQSKAWTAESVVVVLPATKLDATTSASYYETLSRGQIVATFAEVAGNLRFEQQAETRLKLTDSQREEVTTEVSVVPNTAVILVRATSPDAAVAEQITDGVTTLASEYLAGLAQPYRTQIVDSAEGTAYTSSTSTGLLVVAAVVVALVAGLAVQQAAYHLARAIRRALPTPMAVPLPSPSPGPKPEGPKDAHHSELARVQW